MVDTTTTDAVKVPILKQSRLRELLAKLWPVNGASQDIAALDGLRGVAVFLTLINHMLWSLHGDPRTNLSTFNFLDQTKEFWQNTQSGVDLFFVLSGFLLFIPYARTIFGLQSYPSIRKFYIRRALRILPAYWVSLFLIVLLLGQSFLNQNKLYDVGLHILLVQNWTGATFQSINPPFWTMAIESQFYLVLPLLAWLLYKVSGRGWNWIIGGLLLVSLVSPAYGFLQSYANHHNNLFTQHVDILALCSYLCVFAVGMGCSCLYVAVNAGKFRIMQADKLQILCKGLGLVGIILLVGYFLALNSSVLLQKASGVIYAPIVGLAYGCILLGVLFGWPGWVHFLSWPPLRFVGIISYSLYIWNWQLYARIVLPVADVFQSIWMQVLIYMVLTFVVLIPFAWIFYYLVERPFIKIRRKQH